MTLSKTEHKPQVGMSWGNAEVYLKKGHAAAYRQFSIRQIAHLISSSFTLTENMNKIYTLSRRPWTPHENARKISFQYPIYICLDGGQYNLRMHNGVVQKVPRPNTSLELNYLGLIYRMSKPLKANEKSMILYNGPYTDVSIQDRVKRFLAIRQELKLDNEALEITVGAQDNN